MEYRKLTEPEFPPTSFNLPTSIAPIYIYESMWYIEINTFWDTWTKYLNLFSLMQEIDNNRDIVNIIIPLITFSIHLWNFISEPQI